MDNIEKIGKEICTRSLVSEKVYGEKIIKRRNIEYRAWEPERSKLAAALYCGLNIMPIKEGSVVLYLGASTGTTVSHVSDIVGRKGLVYAIEFAERVMGKLIQLAENRKNIMPIFADARRPENYLWIEQADVVYVDIAQPDETNIAIRNAKTFLKKGGFLMLAIKSQSIDVTKNPKQVYEEEKAKLEVAGFSVKELIDIDKFEKAHGFIVAEM